VFESGLVNAFEAATKEIFIGWIALPRPARPIFPYKYKVYAYGQPLTEYLLVLGVRNILLGQKQERAKSNLSVRLQTLNKIRIGRPRFQHGNLKATC